MNSPRVEERACRQAEPAGSQGNARSAECSIDVGNVIGAPSTEYTSTSELSGYASRPERMRSGNCSSPSWLGISKVNKRFPSGIEHVVCDVAGAVARPERAR